MGGFVDKIPVDYSNPRVKYQLLLYKRRELEKKRRRKELIVRMLLIGLVIIIIVYSYWWYRTTYLVNNSGQSLYSVNVDKTAVLQYDSLMSPYVVFGVHFSSNNPDFDVGGKDFSSDIKVLGGYSYSVNKLENGDYLVKVAFDNNIPSELQVEVKGSVFIVSIIQELSVKIASIKAPETVVLNEDFDVYIYVLTSSRVTGWRVATNIRFVGGRVSFSQSDSGFLYAFHLVLNPDKYTKSILVKIYSPSYNVSKLVSIPTKIVEKRTQVQFSIQSKMIMDNPEVKPFVQFNYLITTNYNGVLYLEYKNSEHLSVDVQSNIQVLKGDNVVEGRVYLVKSVDQLSVEDITLILKDSSGNIIDKRVFQITIFPSLSKIKISPTAEGLTSDNQLKVSIDFFSQLKGVSAKISSCTAETTDNQTLKCNYDDGFINLEYNKITSAIVLIDTRDLVLKQWKGGVNIKINIEFYSQNIKFNKGVSIQTQVMLQ